MLSSQVTYEIQAELEEWHQTPRQINNGECEEFINRVFQNADFPQEIRRMDTNELPAIYVSHEPTYKSEPYHMWITDRTHHYDPEVPDGVDSWKNLPFFKRTLGL